jgi:hypothetical protein
VSITDKQYAALDEFMKARPVGALPKMPAGCSLRTSMSVQKRGLVVFDKSQDLYLLTPEGYAEHRDHWAKGINAGLRALDKP